MKMRTALILLLFFHVSPWAYYWKTVIWENRIIVCRDDGIDIYDLDMLPEEVPVLSYSLTDRVNSAAAAGNHVFLATEDHGVISLDISDTSAPLALDTLDIGEPANDIYIRDTYAFVAAGNDGLLVIDISDPGAMDSLNLLRAFREGSELAVEGNTLFLSCGSMYSFDISDPVNPVLLDNLPNPSTSSPYKGVASSGSIVYGASGHGGLRIIDASTPGELQEIGSYNIGGSMVSGVNGVAISGIYAFVAYYEKGLHVLDISDPALPGVIMKLDLDGRSSDAVVSGDWLLVTDLVTGMKVFSIEELIRSSDYEQDLLAVKAILEANGIMVEDVSPYVTDYDGRVATLDLQGLGLTIIPSAIGQLTGLLEIDLSNNRISQIDTAISHIPLSRFVDSTVYGCQVYVDGSCIAWGNVLATVKVDLVADLDVNELCDVDSTVSAWLDSE